MGCWSLMAILHMNKFGQVSTSRAWSLRAGECSIENFPIWHWHVWCSDGLDFFTLISHGTECHICGLQWAFWLGRWLITHEWDTLIYVSRSNHCLHLLTKKRCTTWELQAKFYLGQKEDCSLGSSISDSSERLLQNNWGGKSIYKVWWRGTSVP